MVKSSVKGSPTKEGKKLANSLKDAFGDNNQDPISSARDELLDAMQSTGPERVERLQKMMDKFEERMDDRGEARMAAGQDADKVEQEIQDAVSQTYEHLTELAGRPDQKGQIFDQKTRQFLAENFMLHAADPTTMDQGQNASCWLESGTICGMINSPEHMARYTKEVSLTGSYRSHNTGEGAHNQQGQTYRFNPNIFRPGREEANWSIANSASNGDRSPVSKVFDEGMSAMVGRRTPDWGSYGGSQGSRRIMYMVTGKVVSDSSHLKGGSQAQTLLEDGGYINYQPRHMKSVHLSKMNGQWAVIQDNQWSESRDYVAGYVNNLEQWRMSAAGHRTSPFRPGGNNQNIGPLGPMPRTNRFPNSPFPHNPSNIAYSPTPTAFSPSFSPGPSQSFASPGGGGGGGGGGMSPMEILMLLFRLLGLIESGAFNQQ